MELPLDHFRLLGVSPVASAEQVLRTLEQRLERAPSDGFTSDAIESRALLLRSSADLLCDSERREHYERLLTDLNSHDDSSQPALEVASHHEVGALLLLMEAGQPAEAFEGAWRALQPPQAPALGSGRELDLTLLAGLAAQRAGADRRHDRRFEAAAQLLHQGIQLLQRMGQQPDLRQTLENDLKGLLPYRILDLISRDLNDRSNREHGLELLLDLVERRGGLDGEEDKEFPQEAFQSFFQQIRGFLTVQEQIDLFQLWSEAGSVTAEFLRAYALTASGFAQRKPERIQESLDRLALLQDVGVEPEMACLHLLLGHTDAAESCFQRGSDEALKQWARDQGDDPLAGLCVYCCDWLERQVLPCYRDLEADPDLEAYFADRDVQAFIERDDRRRSRDQSFNNAAAGQAPEPITEFELLPSLDAPTSLEELLEDPDTSEQEPESKATSPWPQLAAQATALRADLASRLQELSGPLQERAGAWKAALSSRVQATSKPQRLAAAGALVTVAVLGGVGLQQRNRPSTPVREALLLPEPTPVAALETPIAKRAASELAAANAAAETRALLQQWLSAKAELLAGADTLDALKPLAVADLVNNTQESRALDAAAGVNRRVSARINSLELSGSTPKRREARTEISYSEELLSSDGQVLQREAPQTLKNTYIFHKQGDRWLLADFRPTP